MTDWATPAAREGGRPRRPGHAPRPGAAVRRRVRRGVRRRRATGAPRHDRAAASTIGGRTPAAAVRALRAGLADRAHRPITVTVDGARAAGQPAGGRPRRRLRRVGRRRRQRAELAPGPAVGLLHRRPRAGPRRHRRPDRDGRRDRAARAGRRHPGPRRRGRVPGEATCTCGRPGPARASTRRRRAPRSARRTSRTTRRAPSSPCTPPPRHRRHRRPAGARRLREPRALRLGDAGLRPGSGAAGGPGVRAPAGRPRPGRPAGAGGRPAPADAGLVERAVSRRADPVDASFRWPTASRSWCRRVPARVRAGRRRRRLPARGPAIGGPAATPGRDPLGARRPHHPRGPWPRRRRARVDAPPPPTRRPTPSTRRSRGRPRCSTAPCSSRAGRSPSHRVVGRRRRRLPGGEHAPRCRPRRRARRRRARRPPDLPAAAFPEGRDAAVGRVSATCACTTAPSTACS